MPTRGVLLAATFAAALITAAGCGGGGGGGGGGGDIEEEATQVEQLLERLKSLPTTATTQQEFSQQLRKIRVQVQTEVQEVQDAEASDEQASAKEKLASRLRSLRTQLGRIQGVVDSGNLEGAQNGLPRLLSIGEVERAIEEIREAGG